MPAKEWLLRLSRGLLRDDACLPGGRARGGCAHVAVIDGQAAGMFLGECLCLIVFYILVRRSRTTGKPVDTAKPFPLRIFLAPAMCDMTGTSLMCVGLANFTYGPPIGLMRIPMRRYVGLSLTFASTFQMLRGIVVVFTAVRGRRAALAWSSPECAGATDHRFFLSWCSRNG